MSDHFTLKELVVRVAQPIFLGQVVNYFQHDSKVSYNTASWCAAGVVACSAFLVTFQHLNLAYVTKMGMRMRVACIGLMYKKVCLSRTSSDISRSVVSK